MAKLADRYLSERASAQPDLTGVWVDIRSVQTSAYLSGTREPDRVAFDSTGLRDGTSADAPFSWTLTFARNSGRTYVLTQRMGGKVVDISNVTLDTAGDFRFNPNFGSDEEIAYGCRIAHSARVICFDFKHAGDGHEFRQTSTTIPPAPRPFCPLACASECTARCDVTPLSVLAEATRCYHLVYPLTHMDSIYATDTWLALAGDSLGPMSKWQYAAVFDDGVWRVAGWRLTATTSFDLALTFNGKNKRGDLHFTKAGIDGEMADETTGRGWGLEGERRACPSPSSIRR